MVGLQSRAEAAARGQSMTVVVRRHHKAPVCLWM